MILVSSHADSCQIDGDVYDVSSGKAYLPGGPYHTMLVSDFPHYNVFNLIVTFLSPIGLE